MNAEGLRRKIAKRRQGSLLKSSKERTRRRSDVLLKKPKPRGASQKLKLKRGGR